MRLIRRNNLPCEDRNIAIIRHCLTPVQWNLKGVIPNHVPWNLKSTQNDRIGNTRVLRTLYIGPVWCFSDIGVASDEQFTLVDLLGVVCTSDLSFLTVERSSAIRLVMTRLRLVTIELA